MVAKSYQKMKILGDPYIKVNNKMYVKVQNLNNGTIREVRWYSETEYARMYLHDKVETKPKFNQKSLLGFQKGYITIFKGDTEKYEHWFNRSIARFCTHWGWYIVSTDTIPFDLPADLEPVQLNWEIVGEGTNLRSDKDVRTAVDSLLYSSHPSIFQGSIGDRLELKITVIKSYQTENHFGKTAHHIFEDANGNHYAWDTGAKFWAEGSIKTIRGSVKEHKIINNIQTTVLTRCLEQMK